jgi:anti-sigma-K factor RskA
VRALRHDLHVLAGAYALDAVDGPERDSFERHLRRCRSCDNEVKGLAETATALAMAAAEPPPPGLRSRVLAATAVTRQLPPVPATDPAGQSRRPRRVAAPWIPRLATGIALACLAIAVGFGVVGVSDQHRLSVLQAQNRAIAAVLAAPDARIASQSTSRGGTATVVVSRSENAVVVSTRGLPPLPASRVYQLWLIGPPRTRSAGLVPPASAGRTALVLATGLRAGDQVGMTVEPAGGTSQPTTKPILLMSLPD